MQSLLKLLGSIDGQGYKGYKRLQGEYQFASFQLSIDHVQCDPFSEPSRCRIFVSLTPAVLPDHLYSNFIRRIAMEDFLGRRFAAMTESMTQGRRGFGQSGSFEMVAYGQQVLQRNALMISQSEIEVRFQIGLPANERRIDSAQACIMFGKEFPVIVESALLQLAEVLEQTEQHVLCIEDQ
ncbi:MAG: putative ABC-class ATPase, partial [Gammaproteobacteria bacterium]